MPATTAWYVGTELSDTGRAALLDRVLADAGVEPVVGGLPTGVEVVRRRGEGVSFLFVMNHGDEAVDVPYEGTDLLTGTAGPVTKVPAGGVAVIRGTA